MSFARHRLKYPRYGQNLARLYHVDMIIRCQIIRLGDLRRGNALPGITSRTTRCHETTRRCRASTVRFDKVGWSKSRLLVYGADDTYRIRPSLHIFPTRAQQLQGETPLDTSGTGMISFFLTDSNHEELVNSDMRKGSELICTLYTSATSTSESPPVFGSWERRRPLWLVR